jgi:SAM-dependent methyltransferase
MNQLDKLLSKVGDLNFRRRIVKVLEYLQVNSNDIVLDAGCGEGFYSMMFSRLYSCHICAIDNDERILEKAKIWMNENGNVDFKLGNLCKLEYSNNYFDKIVCSEVLEHIPEEAGAVRELYRVLKSGGVIAVTVPNKNYPFLWDPLNKIREFLGLGHFNPKSEIWGGVWAYDHKRLYAVGDINNLLTDAGFQVETLEVLTHYGLPFNHLLLVLGKRFYTRLPVPESVKNSMEKFKWEENSSGKGKIVSKCISTVLDLFKIVDKLNDRKFNNSVSSMAISIKARKP